MKERALAGLHRVDDYQQQHAWVGLPFGVIRKFSEDQASNLAALVAYYAFFSIFPLLLAAETILGFFLQGNPGLQHSVTNSWLSQIPLIGSSFSNGHSLQGSGAGLAVGVVLALWSGLAVARTAQTAFNSVYDVPMAERPGFLDKTKRAGALVVIVGIGLVASTGISGIVTGSGSFLSSLHLGIAAKIGGAALAVVIDVAVFALAFNQLTVRDVSWREALPGATFAAVGWYVLQLASTAIVTHKLSSAHGTYGQFAVVIVLLSWFYLAAQLVLLGAELNVVLAGELWPRAILDRPQTDADYRALEAYAEEQRYVEPEGVDTDYADSGRQRKRDEVVRDR